jgi:23S rRNA (cytosine1962-C5)-methyltransferase
LPGSHVWARARRPKRVRLRPKAEARAIRHGFPWVYADELVTDRRTQALAPGTLAVLEDAERRPLGLVTVNPASKIIARMLDRDPAAQIGTATGSPRG